MDSQHYFFPDLMCFKWSNARRSGGTFSWVRVDLGAKPAFLEGRHDGVHLIGKVFMDPFDPFVLAHLMVAHLLWYARAQGLHPNGAASLALVDTVLDGSDTARVWFARHHKFVVYIPKVVVLRTTFVQTKFALVHFANRLVHLHGLATA